MKVLHQRRQEKTDPNENIITLSVLRDYVPFSQNKWIFNYNGQHNYIQINDLSSVYTFVFAIHTLQYRLPTTALFM